MASKGFGTAEPKAGGTRPRAAVGVVADDTELAMRGEGQEECDSENWTVCLQDLSSRFCLTVRLMIAADLATVRPFRLWWESRPK